MGDIITMPQRDGSSEASRPVSPAPPQPAVRDSGRGRLYTVKEMVDRWPATPRLKAGQCPSVTTVLDTLRKNWFGPWAAKMERAWIMDRLVATLSDPDDELADAMASDEAVWLEVAQLVAGRLDAKLGRYAYMGRSLEAATFGTHVHAIIDARINGKPDPEATPKEIEAADVWSDWAAGAGYQTIWTEQRVYHPDHRYAGRADTFAQLGPVKTVIDWKTSKEVRSNQFIQVAAYAKAIEALTGETGIAGLVVRIPKTDGDRIECRLVTADDIEKEHFPAFLALRKAWDWADKFDNDEDWKKRKKAAKAAGEDL